jgi:hypothetical protein
MAIVAASLMQGDCQLACSKDAGGVWVTPELDAILDDDLPDAGDDAHQEKHQQRQQHLLLSVEASIPYGLMWVELERGGLLSEAQPVLVLNDQHMAAEVAQLERDMCSEKR